MKKDKGKIQVKYQNATEQTKKLRSLIKNRFCNVLQRYAMFLGAN